MKNRKKLIVESPKPFKLVKYFSLTSLVVILLGAIVISVVNIHWIRAMEKSKSAEFASLLVENLNHQVFYQFIFPVVLKYGKIQLREKEQFDHLDKLVKNTLHSFKVDMVNIYDMKNMISYSFDRNLVGTKNPESQGYKDSLEGKSSSEVIYSGNYFENLMGIPQEIKMVTFAPLRAEQPLSNISGPVLGVIEIVQDISKDYREIYRFQILVIVTSTIVMGTLFVVLFLIVKRGESIIDRRTLERIRLRERLNRAKHLSSLGEMAAGISHEIRNPLGIIMSSAALLRKKTNGSGKSNAIANIIVEEAERLNNLITDFLNFAKPMRLNLQPCQLSEIIEKNIAFLSAEIRNLGFTIKKQYNEPLPVIMADAVTLYQAFLNILINAMQAMPDGGAIGIRINTVDETVLIEIEDGGQGIPQDIEEKIWNPFFTTKEKGTGLGLGIVKNIIESHNGAISITDRASGGARVEITLPVQKI